MIHNQDETDVITRLTDTVLQLSRKVEQLETTLASVTTIYKTKHGHSTRINTTALSILQLLNNDVVPSMNMDAFMAFLANMPCDAESVVDKKSAEVIADLVIDGIETFAHNIRQNQPNSYLLLSIYPWKDRIKSYLYLIMLMEEHGLYALWSCLANL